MRGSFVCSNSSVSTSVDPYNVHSSVHVVHTRRKALGEHLNKRAGVCMFVLTIV